MCRLIANIYRRFLGLEVRSNEQRCADLQQVLNELTEERQRIDLEIDRATTGLIAAFERRDALAKKRQEPPAPIPARRTGDIPRISLEEC